MTVGNKTYDFNGWSDGGAQTHTITTPSANQTITATYKRRKGRVAAGDTEAVRTQNDPFIDDRRDTPVASARP